MIGPVLALIKTLFDIVRLRKGPDSIPRSSVVFTVVIAMWLAAGALVLVLIKGFDSTDFAVGVLTSVVGLLCYASIVLLLGHGGRVLQTLTAVVGCGALLEVLFVVSNVLLKPFAGDEFSGVAATLVLLWSVPVEGHILARAIDKHWYSGVIIAMAVFILQYYLSTTIHPIETGSP